MRAAPTGLKSRNESMKVTDVSATESRRDGPRIHAETELAAATGAYHAWVAARLDTLVVQVNYLSSDLLGDGGIAHAKRDWLAAHLPYETLGPVKRAFGT